MKQTLEFPEILDGEDKSCDLKNRIRKNYRHVRKWAKRTQTNCFRVYDGEVREFPYAIDYYADRYCIHHFAGDSEGEAGRRQIESALRDLLGAESNALYWRERIKRGKTEQYEKVKGPGESFLVQEYGVQFEVNLVNYLDTGLFLDHRETRQRVAGLCKGKRLLNLFAYTCAFSVHAAHQGAAFTKSVDLSNTYTAWGRRNFELNELPAETNEIVRADCLRFLENPTELFDVIVVDPPTLSRSKKMTDFFDIQEDYIPLLEAALRWLAPDGTLFFSTNSRKFRFDSSAFPEVQLREISDKTRPLDFYNPKIHKCWTLRLINR